MIRLIKYNLTICLLTGLLFISAMPTFAQENSFHFKRLGLEDGLSQSSVTSIIQDNKGFMWFGTVGGLNRYDGQQMTIYRSDLIDNNSLSNKQVTDICKDSDGNLWIATINGLTYFNVKTEQFHRYYEEDGPESISSNTVNAVYCDAASTVWIATDNGLDKMVDKDQGVFAHFTINNGEENNFQEVYRDRSGVLWTGTFGDGLYYLDQEKEQLTDSEIAALDDKIITVMHEDDTDHLWVGTETGLFQLSLKRNKVTAYTNETNNSASLSDNTVNAIYQDSQSNLWVGTENGLNLYQPENRNFIRFRSDSRDEQSISSNRIHSIYEDDQNTVWIGTWSTGINKFSYHKKGIKHYYYNPESDNSISDNNVWDFIEDDDNKIWIGTDGGLNSFEPETDEFDHYTHDPNDENSLSSNRIFNLELDSSGNIWMATIKGVNKFDPESGNVERFLHESGNSNSLSYNTLWSLDIDSTGNVWIATIGRGLDVLDPQTGNFAHFDHDPDDPKSLSSSSVTEIYVDSKNQIWIGTRNGLNLYQSQANNFKKFPFSSENPHSLDNSSVMDMHEDSKGRIWVGTAMGVSVVDIESHEVLKFLSRTDGLPDDTVWGITEDHNGTIYLGTTLGLAVWDSETETFNTFDKRDGLQGNEFNAGAAFTSSTGKIYMGGTNGFNTFFPSELTGNPHAPPVAITDFQLFNKSVPVQENFGEKGERREILKKSITYTDTLTLSHSDNLISFEFAALNYTIPEKNHYAYKLEGFDDKWNYIGDRNFVTYTELSPGEYTFRVKASNNDGVWNEEGTSLALIITPPFWQTTWFYLLSVLFVLGVIVSGYRIRVRSIKEYSKRLEKEVADRTSELNERNEQLKDALEELEKTKDELVEKARKAGMADLATGILHNVGNILNSVNTSATLIKDTMKRSKLEGLEKANAILRENIDQIEQFVANHPKGKKIMQYYLKLEQPLKDERQKVLKQSKRLIQKIELINEAVAAQQNYAGTGMYADETSLSEIIDNALALQAGSIERHGLEIEKDLKPVDSIMAHRSKLIHVLVNIFKNAKESMSENPPENRNINIKSWQDEDWVYLSISDNGAGIEKENLDKIFTQEFTTKKNGHGFGLHSSANYMAEMGGKITVESDGKDKGATFTLIFPSNSKSSNEKEEEM